MLITDRTLDPHAAALIARMTVPPTRVRADLINDTIRRLKDAHAWGKLDGFYMLAAHDSQAARLNWANAFFTISAVNSPTFTADRGYAGDGSTSYLDTVFNPAASIRQYAQNDAHLGVWPRNATSAGDDADIGNLNAFVFPRNTGDQFATRANDATSSLPSSSSSSGHFAWSRTGSASYTKYYNGAGSSVGTASSIVQSRAFYMLAYNGPSAAASYSPHQVAFGHFGAGLSDIAMANLYKIAADYLTAVGAN